MWHCCLEMHGMHIVLYSSCSANVHHYRRACMLLSGCVMMLL
jgi:hypothetical protein